MSQFINITNSVSNGRNNVRNGCIFSLSEINEALSSSTVHGVMAFRKISVYANEWEACLEELNEACAFSWVKKNNNIYPYPITPEIIDRAQGTRQRLLFSETRLCHRSGRYESVATATSDRPVQKVTKKVGCPAKLSITCAVSRPDVFVFEIIGEHRGHTPGDRLEDLRTLPLARRMLDQIDHQLTSTGQTTRDVRARMSRYIDRFGRLSERRVNYNDVYNRMKKVCS